MGLSGPLIINSGRWSVIWQLFGSWQLPRLLCFDFWFAEELYQHHHHDIHSDENDHQLHHYHHDDIGSHPVRILWGSWGRSQNSGYLNSKNISLLDFWRFGDFGVCSLQSQQNPLQQRRLCCSVPSCSRSQATRVAGDDHACARSSSARDPNSRKRSTVGTGSIGHTHTYTYIHINIYTYIQQYIYMTIAGEPHLGPSVRFFCSASGRFGQKVCYGWTTLARTLEFTLLFKLYIKEAEKHLAEMPAFLWRSSLNATNLRSTRKIDPGRRLHGIISQKETLKIFGPGWVSIEPLHPT